MLDFTTEFPAGNITPADANYPTGSAKDVSAQGAGDGTPRSARLVNDSLGFALAALAAAGFEPNGSPDTALASQVLQALGVNSMTPTAITHFYRNR
jgi:hypothetical protein